MVTVAASRTAELRQPLTVSLIIAALTGVAAGERVPTFSRDIAPILKARCVACHRPGQIGPMPLISYKQVRPWAKSIRDEVVTRRMPPWRADPAFGHFENDPQLDERARKLIAAWAEGGAPEGDPRATPRPARFDGEWNIGKPDAELAMPRAFTVPPKGELDLQYFTVDPGNKEDRYITAAEIRAGAAEVVHHAAVYIVPAPGGELPPDPDFGAPCDKKTAPRPRKGPRARDYLFSWSPGSPPFVAPPGSARILPAGARLLFELHYTTVGRPVSDRTRIALRFGKTRPAARVFTIVAENRAIVIPPRDPDYRASACIEISRPVTLIELKPHMHLRGRAMTFTLVEPAGRREVLLSVPDWSFDWQLAYRLARPRLLPVGARIEVDARYDNSAANKANPAPDQEVRWDDWWMAEMLAGMITVVDR